MIARYDVNGDNQIDYSEFLKVGGGGGSRISFFPFSLLSGRLVQIALQATFHMHVSRVEAPRRARLLVSSMLQVCLAEVLQQGGGGGPCQGCNPRMTPSKRPPQPQPRPNPVPLQILHESDARLKRAAESLKRGVVGLHSDAVPTAMDTSAAAAAAVAASGPAP